MPAVSISKAKPASATNDTVSRSRNVPIFGVRERRPVA
jgi:hypothetical protein